jgi:hypothetical protein
VFEAGKNNHNYKHGATNTREYNSWCAMRARCDNKEFENYGARGITVCPRWQGERGFENFLADMGPRPKGTTLDRWPNGDGNYEPGNCRWANASDQNKNRRSQARDGKGKFANAATHK